MYASTHFLMSRESLKKGDRHGQLGDDKGRDSIAGIREDNRRSANYDGCNPNGASVDGEDTRPESLAVIEE